MTHFRCPRLTPEHPLWGFRYCYLFGLIALSSAPLWPAAVQATTLYVDSNGGSPTPPYSNWLYAATTIQDAVDAVSAGDLVLVTNGVYSVGGRVAQEKLTNRVAVTKPLVLQSVHGPEYTVIQGYQAPTNFSGDLSVRCVYLAAGAVLDGFTLSSGGARSWPANQMQEQSGGGVWCVDRSAVVTNCVIVGNSVDFVGGGAFSGTLRNCRIEGNFAESEGGGAYISALYGCLLQTNTVGERGGGTSEADLVQCTLVANRAQSGGGAFLGNLTNCKLESNQAGSGGAAFYANLIGCTISHNRADSGGGVYMTTLYNCSLQGNTARLGAGAWGSQLVNCTLVGNVASDSGGGVFYSRLTNSISFFNTAVNQGANWVAGTADHCCLYPLPPGTNGNISTDPQLVDAFHLASTSPCRGLGRTLPSMGVDFDGDPWLSPPSIGCDEVVEAALAGPLSVSIAPAQATILADRTLELTGQVNGRAGRISWKFGDGATAENASYLTSHKWSAPGDYSVAFTAFNADYPLGVTTNLLVAVTPVKAPGLVSVQKEGAELRLWLGAQPGAVYWLEYTTSLNPPASWSALPSVMATTSVLQLVDTAATNTSGFYRVRAQ